MTNKNFSLMRALAISLTTISPAAAHGYVQGIVAEGQYYQGYRPNFQWQQSTPQVAGWSDPLNINNGYVSDYTSPDIICHLGATPGQTYVTVEAGDTVTLQWTPWPTAHLGPILTYLANCNGECTNVAKTDLLFNKIDEVGLIQGGSSPGHWAVNELLANNNSWTVTIPSQVAPGNYVLRNEIIALQEAQTLGRAQNYPQCINLKVTGTGTNTLSGGTQATQMYRQTDPGLFIDIYQALSNYTIPGPQLLTGLNSTTTDEIRLAANITTSTMVQPRTFVTSTLASTSSTTFSATVAGTTSTVASLPLSASVATLTTTSSSTTLSSTTSSPATLASTTTSMSSAPMTITLPQAVFQATVPALTLTITLADTNSTSTVIAVPSATILANTTGLNNMTYPNTNLTNNTAISNSSVVVNSTESYQLATFITPTTATSTSSGLLYATASTTTSTTSTSVTTVSTVLASSSVPLSGAIRRRLHVRDFAQVPCLAGVACR